MDSRTFLARLTLPELMAWRGQRPLPVVFWGYGVSASLLLALLHATALDLGQPLIEQGLIAFSALYTFWIVVAIWRCAATASPFWGTAARLLTVAWALNSVFVLVFLQLELVIRFARG